MTSADWVTGWQSPPQDKVRYQIQREERLTCFGNPGYVMEWRVEREFDTAEERDRVFAKMQKDATFDKNYRKHDFDPRSVRVML